MIDVLLQKDVLKGKLTSEEKNLVLKRLSVGTQVSDLKQSDLVVEAVSEQPNLKRELFASLDQILPSHSILASNTSSISITRLAQATKRPDRVIGMHFMNPVPVMKLVEIIPGLATSQETLKTTIDLAHQMGKTTTQSLDRPGFIANRILMPYINEAIFTLQEVFFKT